MFCHTPKYVLFCFWECVWLEYVPSISIPFLGTINILIVRYGVSSKHWIPWVCFPLYNQSHPSISSQATRGNLHKPSSSAISCQGVGGVTVTIWTTKSLLNKPLEHTLPNSFDTSHKCWVFPHPFQKTCLSSCWTCCPNHPGERGTKIFETAT